MTSRRKEAQNAKRKRGRKKIVLMIVEGPSDVEALAEPLANTIYALDPDIEFYPSYLGDKATKSSETEDRGDVTSKYGVNPTSVEHVIDKLYLRPFFQNTPFYPKDITKIVHVVDTDGAFVPNECIMPAAQGAIGHIYHDDSIVTSDVPGIIERNERKADNLRHLASIATIKTGYDKKKRAMPYGIYFFSSNLDHFLHGDANIDSHKKVLLAKEFADRCCKRPSLFFDTIQGDARFVGCDYAESWSLIQAGCSSLERHTNIGNLIDEFQRLAG